MEDGEVEVGAFHAVQVTAVSATEITAKARVLYVIVLEVGILLLARV